MIHEHEDDEGMVYVVGWAWVEDGEECAAGFDVMAAYAARPDALAYADARRLTEHAAFVAEGHAHGAECDCGPEVLHVPLLQPGDTPEAFVARRSNGHPALPSAPGPARPGLVN